MTWPHRVTGVREEKPARQLPPLVPTLTLLLGLAGKALLGAALGLALLELALRLAGLPEGVGSRRMAYDLDDATLGVYQAGGRIRVAWPPELAFDANFNSFGCRGAEPATLDPPPIITIGDSRTFGFGVDDDETWSAVLERRLGEEGTPRGVLNFGSPMLTIQDQMRYLRRALPALGSKIVILFPDDQRQEDELDKQGRTYHERILERTLRRRRQAWRPAIRSLAISEARFVSAHWRKQLVLEGRGEYPPAHNDHPLKGDPESPLPYERGVAAAKELVESHGASLVLVLLPERGFKDGRVILGETWTRRSASKLGVPYVDLYAAFSPRSNLDELYLLPYDTHPGPLGHRVIAEAVLDVLREQALID